MNDIPRRNDIWRRTPAEISIDRSMREVEGLVADPRLTDAVILLERARNKVSDFVDGVGK